MNFEEELKKIEENAKIRNRLNKIGIYTIKGPTGPKGDSLNIKDSYNTIEELYKEHPQGENNDCYVVNGSLYI